MTNLPQLLPIQAVADRLSDIFPESFPDRSILIGDMATRLVFVALYGGFIEGSERYFRPSTVIRFSAEQAAKTTTAERLTWLAVCQAAGYKPSGQWYADNTREPLRDDLIRNRAIPIGLVKKLEGIAPTSPAPIYSLAKTFADLFDPDLEGNALIQKVEAWRQDNLDPQILRRMRLIASGVLAKEGQVQVDLPTTGKRIRLAAGEASVITRDVCEQLFRNVFRQAVVIHISVSDQKTCPDLDGEATAIGLELSTSAELPDVIAADIDDPKNFRLAFVEVVHSDGPITELRKAALLKIASEMGFSEDRVLLITAFEDRNKPAFKKRLSEIAWGSSVWLRSEPDRIINFASIPSQP